MPNSATILIYGRDPQLLRTRCLILEKAGFAVSTASTPGEVERRVGEPALDLLILCHSLSMEECGRALAVAHSRWPLMKSLVLTAGTSGCMTPGLLNQVLDAMEGPVKLISTVGRLLATADSAHSHMY